MKNTLKLMAIAILSLFSTISIVSCSNKTSADFVGTWKVVIHGFDKSNEYELFTLNQDGKGDWMLMKNNEVKDEDTIKKWFYNDDNETITIIIGDDSLNFKIENESNGGNSIEGTATIWGRSYHFTMNR